MREEIENAVLQHEPNYNNHKGADLLKFFLMPFVCMWAFGFPFSDLYGFAIPAFFILTGYFVLVKDPQERDEKIVRALVRSLVVFVALLAFYGVYNAIVVSFGGAETVKIGKRDIFNFVVLNMWPFYIGNNIWFIQSLLYVWAILLILHRFMLLRYYKIIMIISMIAMILFGEMAGIINFNMFGYTFIPGGAITRALPYVLLGFFMRENMEKLVKIRWWIYLLMFVAGIGLTVGEIYLLIRLDKLVYYGHMIGFGISAFAVCGLALSKPDIKENFFTLHGHSYAKWIYALANPVFYFLVIISGLFFPNFIRPLAEYGGIITYVLCLVLCLIFTGVMGLILKRSLSIHDGPA